MSLSVTLANAARVLGQLRRDRRTIALVLIVPPALLALLKYVFDGQPQTFDRIGPQLVGLFPFTIMFLISSIAMLRERTGGTLERLMSLPLGRVDLLAGYGIAFALLASLQAILTAGVGYGLLGLSTIGSTWLVVVLAVANAILGMALGLFLSAFATSEFQAIQFMPAFVFPQLLLAGLLVPRERMARVLELVSDVLPLTYALDALTRATTVGSLDRWLWRDAAVIGCCIILCLILGATTLRRRTG